MSDGRSEGESEARAYLRQAEMLLVSGDMEGAARALEAAGEELLDREAAAPKRKLSQLLAILGDHRLGAGAPAGALESYRAALSLTEAMASADPALDRERAFLRYRLGTAELAMGRGPAALERFRQGCAEIAALAEDAPEDASLQRDLSASRSMLGDALAEVGQAEPALQEYAAALSIVREVDGADSAQPAAQAYMATLFRRMGALHDKLGRPQEAIGHFQAQAGILESFRRIGAADEAMLRELVEAYRRLARLAPGEARGPLAAALEAASALPAPGDPGLVAQLRRSLETAGGAAG